MCNSSQSTGLYLESDGSKYELNAEFSKVLKFNH